MANLSDYIAWRGDLTFSESEFNAVDSLILCCLVYIHFDDIMSENDVITINEANTAFCNLPQEKRIMRAKEDKALLHIAAKSRRFGNLALSDYVSHFDFDKEKQFAAITINLGRNNTFIAFRGTDNTLIAWKEDFNMSFLDIVPSQIDAAEYLKTVADKIKGTLYIGGHSKGGNLAIYASAHSTEKIQKRIKTIYNHDGPGFNSNIINFSGYCSIINKIQTYVPQSSVIGMLLNHQEPYTVIQSTQRGVLQHDPYSWKVMGADFIKLEGTSKVSKTLDNTLTEWLAHTSPIQRERFVDALYTVFNGTENKKTFPPSTSWRENAEILITQWKNTSPKKRNIINKHFKTIINTAINNTGK